MSEKRKLIFIDDAQKVEIAVDALFHFATNHRWQNIFRQNIKLHLALLSGSVGKQHAIDHVDVLLEGLRKAFNIIEQERKEFNKNDSENLDKETNSQKRTK